MPPDSFLMEEEVPHGGPALGLASSQSEPVGCPGGSINHTSPPLSAVGPSLSTGSFTVVAQQEAGRCSEPSWPTESHGSRCLNPGSHGRSASALAVGVAVFSCSLEWVCRVRGCFDGPLSRVWQLRPGKAGRGCLCGVRVPAEFSTVAASEMAEA